MKGYFLFLVPYDSKVFDKNLVSLASQEKALKTPGIVPDDIPSEIFLGQKKCFEDAVGEDRVAEIKASDSSMAIKSLKAKGCI